MKYVDRALGVIGLLVIAFALLAAVPDPNIAPFPSVSITRTNFVNEQIVTNGMTIGGVRKTAWPAGGGGDTIWTNDLGNVYPVAGATNILIGATNVSQFGHSLLPFGVYSTVHNSDDDFSIVYIDDFNLSGASSMATMTIDTENGTYTGGNPVTLALFNNAIGNATAKSAFYNGGANGLEGNLGYSGSPTGSGSGVNGFASGNYLLGIGVIGSASQCSTNIGLVGSARYFDPTSEGNIGGYFSVHSRTETAAPNVYNSVVLIDNWDSDLPLLTARTNNGTIMFQVPANGAIATGGNTNQWKFLGLTVNGGVTNAHFNINGTNFHSVFIPD